MYTQQCFPLRRSRYSKSHFSAKYCSILTNHNQWKFTHKKPASRLSPSRHGGSYLIVTDGRINKTHYKLAKGIKSEVKWCNDEWTVYLDRILGHFFKTLHTESTTSVYGLNCSSSFIVWGKMPEITTSFKLHK